MTRIVDSHIHMYPPEVFADPVAWGTAHGEAWWTHCVAPKDQPTLQGWADLTRLLKDMDRAGVEKAVMLGWYWENQATCELQNQWFIDWVAAHPDRLMGFATVNPNSGQRGLDNVTRALDAGLCGVGELLPQAQNFSFEDDTWAKLMELVTERDVPVNLHVTSAATITRGATSKPTPLEDFIALVKNFPDTKFILAHWGGGIPYFFRDKSALKPLFKNVYYDTAASPLIYDRSVFKSMIDLVDLDRILFGTDYPLLTHPRLTRQPEFDLDVAEVLEAGLTATQRDKILGENVLRLLKRD